MRIGIIGTDGVPARYGGFETFVEQVAPRLIELGHEVTVVGSSIGRTDDHILKPGMTVINLPLRR